MAAKSDQQKDQQHPQYKTDRQLLSKLMANQPDDYGLAELARLMIRYQGFPGARDIQADLKTLLKQWGLTEESLYAKTREIHQVAQVYRGIGAKRDDWS